MTKVYLVSVDDCAGSPDDLGVFSSFDMAEEFIYRKYNQCKGDWVWEGRAWYVHTVTLDDPETRCEAILVNVYDQPLN